MRRDARADDAFDLKAATDTRLAYVITGLSDVDDMSKAGLTGLGNAAARSAPPTSRRSRWASTSRRTI